MSKKEHPYLPDNKALMAGMVAMMAHESMGASALYGSALISTAPVAIATLCVAGAYLLGKQFFGEDDVETRVSSMLEGMNLKLEVAEDDKKVTAETQLKEPTTQLHVETPTAPIVQETPQGTKVIHIENLNVYLTAELVQQLNINPKEVVNYLLQKGIENHGHQD